MIEFWYSPPLRHASARPVVPPGFVVVTRRIAARPDRLDRILTDCGVGATLRRLDLGAGAALTMATAPQPTGSSRPEWLTVARLEHAGRRLVRFTRIEIRLSAASSDTLELEVRPVCRHPLQWGRRRLRRYFDGAHAVADRLGEILADADRRCATLVELPIGTGRAEPSLADRSPAA